MPDFLHNSHDDASPSAVLVTADVRVVLLGPYCTLTCLFDDSHFALRSPNPRKLQPDSAPLSIH
jgi:hypothetical protein